MERDGITSLTQFPWTISTHTLTWSVTSCFLYLYEKWAFQLTRSRGAWPLLYLYSTTIIHFNSHAHVERDAHALSCSPVRIRFQLTRSRGAWLAVLITTRTGSKFQLTRSRGAWRYLLQCNVSICLIFQLTRSRGAWPSKLPWVDEYIYFNSHAHVERDVLKINISKYRQLFQLTRSRGAWLVEISTLTTGFDFNSHAHVERDTWCCVYLVLAQRDADLLFYLMGIGLILFTVRSQIAWYFHANLLGICGSLGVRWSKY